MVVVVFFLMAVVILCSVLYVVCDVYIYITLSSKQTAIFYIHTRLL